ncbi:MAG: endo-1,4-beta-xylanase [Chitinophagaceae bacterium]|nr:endo-1,4-beta-xylanase [Chitinophagaceae bacterium]
MKASYLFVFLLSSAVIWQQACVTGKKVQKQNITLKQAFGNDFLIGTALSLDQIQEKNPEETALIAEQFNAITPENIMKAEVMQPQWNTFNFEPADKMVEFARKYNMKVNGHTLIWHSQLPAFVRSMKDPDSVRQFFENHIKTIAARYDKKILSWDVVNEALNEDGTMRLSVFLEKLGENYVTEAFRLAQVAAPHTELYYNDYNIEQPAKRKGCINLLKKIQQAGVRLDGVGIQGHWLAGKVPFKDIEESILEFSALGIKVMITELDLEVLPRNVQGADVNQRQASNPALNPYTNGLPDSVQQQLAKDYEALFRLFLKHKDKISRVTFWGVHDGQSWLNDWPIRGRTNHPLLFDRSLKPKPAYYRVLKIKS